MDRLRKRLWCYILMMGRGQLETLIEQAKIILAQPSANRDERS